MPPAPPVTIAVLVSTMRSTHPFSSWTIEAIRRAGLTCHTRVGSGEAWEESVGDRVAGKIALVTGAAAGLGRAIALRLSEEGASLVLADLDSVGLAETERQIRATGRPVMALTADVTEEAPVK